MSAKDTPGTGVCRSAPLARHVRSSVEIWSFQVNEQVRVVTRSLYVFCPLGGGESSVRDRRSPSQDGEYFSKNMILCPHKKRPTKKGTYRIDFAAATASFELTFFAIRQR